MFPPLCRTDVIFSNNPESKYSTGEYSLKGLIVQYEEDFIPGEVRPSGLTG